MFGRIRQLFAKPTPNMSDDSREFITQLSTSHIWVLVIGLRGTPAVPSTCDEDAFRMVDAHRIDVTEIGDDDSVFPFNYERHGIYTLPFFSTEDRARAFRADSGFQMELTYFQPYSLLAGFVTSITSPKGELFTLVLDPRSPGERTLTRDEGLLLQALSNAS